jgi:F-type H+-transporting ATPase subunit gamma
MISPRLLRRRIRSTQNMAKITKAMEMIATAKMKRAQEQATAGRPYNDKITQLVSDLAVESGAEISLHPLLEKREAIRKIAVVHITSDRGLCGGLNANMNRLTAGFILEQKAPVTLITVGRKGTSFMHRQHQDLKAEFNVVDRPLLFDTLPISRILIDDYINREVDLVYLAYTQFISTMAQRPAIELLLPIKPAKLSKTETTEYIYEPDPKSVLEGILPRFVEMRVYHAVLEAIASEHSSRMIAMRNATDNANEIIEHLTLTLNKARQEMITTELLDIIGGVEVLH